MRWKRFALNLSLSETQKEILWNTKKFLRENNFVLKRGGWRVEARFVIFWTHESGPVVFAFAQFMCLLYRTFTNVLRATHERDITNNHAPRHLFAQKCFLVFFYDSKYIFMFFWSSTKKRRRVRWWTFCEADTWHFSQQPAYVYTQESFLFSQQIPAYYVTIKMTSSLAERRWF